MLDRIVICGIPCSGTKLLNAQDLIHLGTELGKCPKLIKIRKQLGYGNISLL